MESVGQLSSDHIYTLARVKSEFWSMRRKHQADSANIKVVNALFLSPLRKIPGPFLARLTPLWLRYIDMSGTRTKTLHELHQRYGATVVIGPNEITANDISNVKELYGQLTTFVKAPIYESMTMEPHGIFGLRDRVAHGQRRKLLSHAFSQSNLQECEPLIQRQLDKLLAAVQQSAGNPIDVLRWFRLAAFDVVGTSTSPIFPPTVGGLTWIIGELFLGQSFGGLDSGQTPQFLDDVELRGRLADLQWNNPWIAASLAYVPLQSVRYFLATMQRLADVSHVVGFVCVNSSLRLRYSTAGMHFADISSSMDVNLAAVIS